MLSFLEKNERIFNVQFFNSTTHSKTVINVSAQLVEKLDKERGT